MKFFLFFNIGFAQEKTRKCLWIHFDVDGVLADIKKQETSFVPKFGLLSKTEEEDGILERLADPRDMKDFFQTMPKIEKGVEFFFRVQNWSVNISLLTDAPRRVNTTSYSNEEDEFFVAAREGKIAWVAKNLNLSDEKVFVSQKSEKPLFVFPGHVNFLIEDTVNNCNYWLYAGGLCVLYEGDFAATEKFLVDSIENIKTYEDTFFPPICGDPTYRRFDT